VGSAVRDVERERQATEKLRQPDAGGHRSRRSIAAPAGGRDRPLGVVRSV
jgi:hypothetical protein